MSQLAFEFDNPLAKRRHARDAAYDAADEDWKVKYEFFILQYLAMHRDGTAEDIRLAYEDRGLPQTSGSKRASGGIFVRLRKAGKIRETGKRKSRLFGNDLTVYERTGR